jgi:hypothetical protein
MRWIVIVLALWAGIGAAFAQEERPDKVDSQALRGVWAGTLSWTQAGADSGSATVSKDVTVEINDQSDCAYAAWTVDSVRSTLGFKEQSCPEEETNWFCLTGDRIDPDTGEVVPSGLICGRRAGGDYESVEGIPESIDVTGESLAIRFTLNSTTGLRLYEVTLVARRVTP